MRAVALMLALAGCGGGGATAEAPPREVGDGCGLGAEPGLIEQTLVVGGKTRRYLISIPPGYQPGRRHALVFGWHGRYSTPGYAHGHFGIEEAAGEAAIVVYPAGLARGADPEDTGWDLDPAGGDVALFDALAAALPRRYCLDEARVFSAGASLGGYFTSALACARGGRGAGRIRAIASVAGGPPAGACPGGPVAALVIHGTADRIVPIAEGAASRAHWAQLAGCDATVHPVPAHASCVAHDGCEAPVWWCAHDQEETDGHVWPAWSGAAAWALFGSLR